MADYPEVEVTSVEALRAWLDANHDTSRGIWLVTYKKAVPDRYVAYDDVVRSALCWGWIDGQARSVDADRSSLLLTPRRPKSGWARTNKQRIAELDAAGLLMPAGRAAVELAKATGTWTALDDVENLIEPAALRAALDAEPEARRHWDGFGRGVKRSILEWISSAKTETTTTKRITEAVTLAAQGRRANQWPRE